MQQGGEAGPGIGDKCKVVHGQGCGARSTGEHEGEVGWPGAGAPQKQTEHSVGSKEEDEGQFSSQEREDGMEGLVDVWID